MRIYVDTNVIMDFLLDRRSSANKLFIDTFKCMYTIVLSDIVLMELDFQKVDYNTFLKMLDFVGKLEILQTTIEEDNSAYNINETHHNDALHYILAKRAGVECFVTSNIRDFPFDDLNIQRPDDLC